MTKINISMIVGIVIALAFISITAFAYNNYSKITELQDKVQATEFLLEGGNWTCVAKSCSTWVYGDAWITDNCRPEAENKTLVCKISLQDGKTYYAPLSIINISNVKSCREYQCLTKVYVKGSMGEKI